MKNVSAAMIMLAKKTGKTEAIYKQLVNWRIRERYSIDDELAILRQRDEKPEEFAEYYDFVESVKAEVKALIENPDMEL